MQRRGVTTAKEDLRPQTSSVQPSTSPVRASRDDDMRTRKPLPRTATAITPRRFNAQVPPLKEKSDYHANGQVLMLKNRVENLEREKERAAAATRDQLIAKEKEHASELSRREERIRQLESQVESLRQQNLQTSFQLHNVSLSGTVDVEMTDTNTTLPPGPLLHTKKINLPRTDIRWKTAAHFGAGASVFANSTSNGVGVENGSQTFAHIPSQMLLDTPGLKQLLSAFDPISVFDVAQQLCPAPVCEKAVVPTENKECQASCVAEDWNIRSAMRESSLESLLGISLISQEQNFSLPILSKLCRVEDHVDLANCLRSEKAVNDDSFL
ncbi:hypothetical protein ANCDUO_11487 [Ancylostoma duodenale]|uniref:Uncharacterized protein n=1 Tax=Ancylostoma duodenale TaxID=51022 RepID=A0A0C2D803_9BILA|nr:hypothetical protein ANCDUO_11487 [Ancylostoma duodenale]